MGRHNKSNGRASDPTYDYDRFAPAHAGPRPCYGKATKDATMTRNEWRKIVATGQAWSHGTKVEEDFTKYDRAFGGEAAS